MRSWKQWENAAGEMKEWGRTLSIPKRIHNIKGTRSITELRTADLTTTTASFKHKAGKTTIENAWGEISRRSTPRTWRNSGESRCRSGNGRVQYSKSRKFKNSPKVCSTPH
jgi:hypothetical protein